MSLFGWSRAKPLAIHSAGVVTSVGFNLPSSAAAIRAAVDNFEETYFKDTAGEPLIGARIPDFSQRGGVITGGVTRMVQLLNMAVEECLASAGITESLPETIPLVLFYEERGNPRHAELVEACKQNCLASFWMASPDFYSLSAARGTFASALKLVRKLIEEKKVEQVLVAAVDSWLNAPDMQQAIGQNRLLSSEQAAGFVPGEAAGAVLIGKTVRRDEHSQVRIVGLGSANETASLVSDEACYGVGLARAITEALDQAGMKASDMNMRLVDIAGEEYFFEESSYAWVRILREKQPPGYQYVLPATRIGHVGAAFGPVLLGYTWHLARNRRALGPLTLIQLSSTSSPRGAIVVHAAGLRT